MRCVSLYENCYHTYLMLPTLPYLAVHTLRFNSAFERFAIHLGHFHGDMVASATVRVIA